MMSNAFERLLPLFNQDILQKFHQSHVVVVGLGGVGGTTLELLARTGIGKLTLIDFDQVQQSNINRQIIATMNGVGEKKAVLFQKRIQDINPNCVVNICLERLSNDNVDTLIPQEASFVVDAIDSIPDKAALIKSCIQRNIPFISSMGMALKTDATKIKVMKLNQTYNDPLAKALRTKLREEHVTLNFDVVASVELAQPKVNGILGSYMGVTSTAGLLVGDYVIKSLAK